MILKNYHWLHAAWVTYTSFAVPAAKDVDLSGQKSLVASARTRDTKVFVAEPTAGDMFHGSCSRRSEDRYPCWSPDGKQICFMANREGTTHLGVCNAGDSKLRRLNRTHDVCYMPSWEKRPRGERIVCGQHGDKPGVTRIKPDGREAMLIESLRFQMAIDGNRASWKHAAD